MNEDVSFELNNANAMWLNERYGKIQEGKKSQLNLALEIGERLVNLKKCHCGTGISFDEWLEGNAINFSRRTAYRYINLYRKKAKLSPDDSLTDAYRKIGEKKDSKADGKNEPQVVEKQEPQVAEKVEPKVGSNLETLSSKTDLFSRLEVIRNDIVGCNDVKELLATVKKSSLVTGKTIKSVNNFLKTMKKIDIEIVDLENSLATNFAVNFGVTTPEIIFNTSKPKIENIIQRIAKNYNNLISNLNNIWGC